MAAPGNQLLDLLRALKRRRYQVLVPALLVATVGCAFAVIVPKRYRVSTRIEITDRMRAQTDPRLRNPQEVKIRTEAGAAYDNIVHFRRVKEVIEAHYPLWPEYAALRSETERQQFISERILQGNLTAAPTVKDPKSGTIFVDITYNDEDKQRAAQFLSELSESWLSEMINSDRATVTSEIELLSQQVDDQQRDLAEKEERMYQLMALLEQDPSQPASDGGARHEDRGDWTFKTLEQARTDLTDVSFKLETAQHDLDQAQLNLQKTPEKISKLAPAKPGDEAAELLKKKALLAEMEEKIEGLTPLNTTYKRLKPKIDELAKEIDEYERHAPDVKENFVDEPNPLHDEYEAKVRTLTEDVARFTQQRDALEASIDDLEQKALARNKHYQDLEDRKNDVAEARRLKNETARQLQDSQQTLAYLDAAPQPWKVAQPPVPSSAKATPNPLLLAAASIMGGLALGVGLALLSELAKTSYRSVSDLASVMSVPVLGAIETIVTREERRRLQVGRAFALLSTAVIVGSIGWITWQWQSAPERLPLELQDAIERLRSALR